MFKFRFGGQASSSPAQPLTIEAVRKRAKHRLIGACVLVLAGVVGFPLLFDHQPRPLPVDIPIDIPARNAVAPLALPTAPAVEVQDALSPDESVATPSEAPSVTPAASPAVSAAPAVPTPPVTATSAPAQSKAALPASADKAPAPKPADAKPVVDEAARAKAILDGLPPKPTNAATRVVVQVGAFAEEARAQEVRRKLEKAGLKTYTHVANTPEGRRVRVRLGPFDSREQAEKAAQKVKALGLPASILTL